MTNKRIFCEVWIDEKWRQLTYDEWFKLDMVKLHRVDGPCIMFRNGNRYWFQNGKQHRDDGPAVEFGDGVREWRSNNQLHRVDGPALINHWGIKEWWLYGKKLESRQVNDWICQNKIDLSTQAGQTAFILKWS